MTKEELALAVIERLKQEYPDADCTLDYDQAWKLLVSVRLAAQCTDARVNVVVEDLYASILISMRWQTRHRRKSRKLCGRAVSERARHATSTPACACCATSTAARCRMT